MKEGTIYASRLRKVYGKLRQSLPDLVVPEPDDPVRRLAIAVIGESRSDEDANRAIDRALATMVDWNEIRVSNAEELNAAMGNTKPEGLTRCQRLIDALGAIFTRENRLSLDRLKGLGRREARQYLEALAGVDEYTVASVLLWCLGGHAIPVNDALHEALRKAELVHPTATRAEVQAFLERNVNASQAKGFCVVMRLFSSGKLAVPDSGKAAHGTRKKGVVR